MNPFIQNILMRNKPDPDRVIRVHSLSCVR
jgi:hypothetical protein